MWKNENFHVPLSLHFHPVGYPGKTADIRPVQAPPPLSGGWRSTGVFIEERKVNTLTARQKKFCDEYLISGNATDAAIKAGYSPKTAKSIGQRLLTFVDLKQYIDTELEKLHSSKIADAQEVLEYLTAVMRGEHTEQVLKLVGDGIQVVENIEVPAKERLKAAELIGKRYALFSDKMDLGGVVPVVITGDGQLED